MGQPLTPANLPNIAKPLSHETPCILPESLHIATMPSDDTKTTLTEHNTAGESAALVPQAHGGALLPGGKKGNKGGPGRLRKSAQDEAIERIQRGGWITGLPDADAWDYLMYLSQTGDTDATRLKALSLMVAYGYGQPRQTVAVQSESVVYVVEVPAVSSPETWAAAYRIGLANEEEDNTIQSNGLEGGRGE